MAVRLANFVVLCALCACAGASQNAYSNPYAGACEKGELNLTVTGVPGLFCSPKCGTVPGYDCDPAKAVGTTAMPECIIGVNSSENNYCALICNTDAPNQCDKEGGAECRHVSGNQGVCTYTSGLSESAAAPDNFLLDFDTDIDGVGTITVSINKSWAPIGVEHLVALVQDGFYDEAAFMRVVGGFVLQFGIAGTPAENKKWTTPIKDDPVLQSNKKYTMSYATAGPNTRTTQLFINYQDNAALDNQGFAPIGTVVAGGQYLDRVHDPTPGDSGGVDQQQYETKGNTWLRSKYPEINFIKKAAIRSLNEPNTVAVGNANLRK